LGSVLAAAFVPIAMLVTAKPLPYIIFSIIGASLVVIRHTSNIKRLVNGTENKIGVRVNVPEGRKK
jgi:glycerol-3-phosphate acyltransferase PlsY